MRTRSLSNMHFGVTGIENMIISEYLVGLNEDEIKVYLNLLLRPWKSSLSAMSRLVVF